MDLIEEGQDIARAGEIDADVGTICRAAMQTPERPDPLDYAGRTPNASGGIDDETRSLGEGCAAVAILALVIPAAGLVVVCALAGCAFVIFSGR